jgi:NADP-dependent 3-hydroxy acid dehydrogenase YdfG
MLNLKDIRNSNRSLQSVPPGLVAVFAGATAGIGLATLQQFAKHANGPRTYIIGRSKEKGSHIIARLKTINPMGTFIFIEGQISLIKEVDRISGEIKKLEKYVDILCMSPGYLSLGGRHGTLNLEWLEVWY